MQLVILLWLLELPYKCNSKVALWSCGVALAAAACATAVLAAVMTGKSSAKLRDNDALEDLLSLMAHDTLLFLSSAGRAYSVKAHKVPEASRAAAGTSLSQVSLPGLIQQLISQQCALCVPLLE
jgi:hypothetical protein